MPSCVVKSCKNYASKLKKLQGITYHEFPRDKHRKDDWVQIIRKCRGESDWDPSPASTVCSAHFDDVDFKTTAKGLRCLIPYAIPKVFLSDPPETPTRGTSTPIPQVLSDPPETQTQSTSSPLYEVPLLTDKFPLTGYCRLCAGSNCNDQLVNVHNDNVLENLVVKMSNRLNTNIDFSQEHLPTTICSACVKTLYTAYDFVVGIDLAQVTLNKISVKEYKYQMPENLKLDIKMELSSTSLHQQESPNIGAAESNFEQSLPFVSNVTSSVLPLSPNIGSATSNFEQPPLLELSTTIPFLHNTPRIRRLKADINKKRQVIDGQRKKLKILNQKVRRLQKRNESLKNIIINLKERNYIDAVYLTH